MRASCAGYGPGIRRVPARPRRLPSPGSRIAVGKLFGRIRWQRPAQGWAAISCWSTSFAHFASSAGNRGRCPADIDDYFTRAYYALSLRFGHAGVFAAAVTTKATPLMAGTGHDSAFVALAIPSLALWLRRARPCRHNFERIGAGPRLVDLLGSSGALRASVANRHLLGRTACNALIFLCRLSFFACSGVSLDSRKC